MTEEQPAEAPEFNPMKEIQDILSRCDETAMVAGFALVAEWIEHDGESSLSVITTPMSPWHMHGMLTYAREHYAGAHSSSAVYVDSFDEDDEDEI